MQYLHPYLYGGLMALSLGLPLLASAQSDSIISLDSVEISARSLRHERIGATEIHLEAQELEAFSGGGLDQLLNQQNGLFVKTYGGGSLATSSIRGGSASHTAVIWNGLPIKSPMLGQLDLSLLPVGFTDELELQYGGNSAMWGSGAIGGTILLNNHLRLDNTVGLGYQGQVGSFGQQSHIASGQWTGKSFGVKTRVLRQQAQNNFTYPTGREDEIREQSNAALSRRAILQELYWRPNAKNRFSAHLWGQNNFREIPPTSSQNQSEAIQADSSVRISLNWQRLGERNLLKARVGLFRESLVYSDPMIRLVSESQFRTAIGEVEQQYQFSATHHLTAGVHYQWTEAISDGYEQPQSQQQLAIFVRDQLQLGKWTIESSLRQQWVDFSRVPLVGSLAVWRPLRGTLRLNARASRNYNLPTLNDLYWFPGGNPNLRAENGWSQEVGLGWQKQVGKQQISTNVQVYSRLIDDWIMWSVREGDNFWSANNITQVWSRGIEGRFAYQIQLGKYQLGLNLGYDFTRSTNQVAIETPKIAAGSQLFYTPIHQASANIFWQWGDLELRYLHRYTGRVETLNLTQLDPYQLGNLRLSYEWERPRFRINLFGIVDNLWNTSYRVLERRPMPGRNVAFGLGLYWNQPTS
ncbi:MAG: TonB-dependent receptor plug domain-containing protein [Bacteroidota bacterium]